MLRNKRKFTESKALIAETQDLLAHPKLNSALGQYSIRLKRVAEQLAPTYIQANKFELPEDCKNKDHVIPVVVHTGNKKLKPGISFNTLPPHRIQRIQNLLAHVAGRTIAIEKSWQTYLREDKGVRIERDQNALFTPLHIDIFNPDEPHNPLLVAPYSAIRVTRSRPSDTIPFFLHELTHCLQSTTVTTREIYDNNAPRDELEAYHIEATTRKALGGIYTRGDGIAEEIEDLRQQYNHPTGDDMFEITVPLQTAIAKLSPLTRRQIRKALALSN